MERLKLVVKGFFIGIANIIPGVSGGTLMISLGVYEDIIHAISHFFTDIKKHIALLLFLGLGGGAALVLMSRVITYALEFYQLPTILFFIGLILGGTPMLYKRIKGQAKSAGNVLVFLLMFSIVAGMTFMDSGSRVADLTVMTPLSYGMLFFAGIVAAATMVIPGVSGSFMLILLGYYEPVLNTINALTAFENVPHNLIILGVFALGLAVGIVLVAKLIEFLINRFEVKTYCGILGFVFASVLSIFVSAINDGLVVTPLQVVAGIGLFVGGFIVALKLGD